VKTILVIDDEESVRFLIHDVLVNPDCRVLQASDGANGLELAARETPQLILLDYRMPGTSGIEVLRSLQENPQTANTPVVLMIATGTDETLYGLLAASAAAYLLKPFSPSELLLKMQEVLTPGRGEVAESIIARLGATEHAA
jgi:two-component system, OmpR family, phosphate regulon response regulator PhoB